MSNSNNAPNGLGGEGEKKSFIKPNFFGNRVFMILGLILTLSGCSEKDLYNLTGVRSQDLSEEVKKSLENRFGTIPDNHNNYDYQTPEIKKMCTVSGKDDTGKIKNFSVSEDELKGNYLIIELEYPEEDKENIMFPPANTFALSSDYSLKKSNYFHKDGIRFKISNIYKLIQK